MTGGGEAVDVTDPGDEDRRQYWPDPGELLDGVITAVVTQQPGDRVGQLVDLTGEGVNEGDERLDALYVSGVVPDISRAQVGG
jgi:hypothetical protein